MNSSDLTTKKAISKIKDYSDISELKEFANGESRRSVLDATDKKLAKLKSSEKVEEKKENTSTPAR